jgi:hypothetical protein
MLSFEFWDNYLSKHHHYYHIDALGDKEFFLKI